MNFTKDMTSSVGQVKTWLGFILDPDTPLKQTLQTFTSLSELQVRAITEIFHNLMNNPELSLEGTLKRKLTNRKWRTLAKHNTSIKRKRNFIKENKREILHILLSIKDTLQKIIDYE